MLTPVIEHRKIVVAMVVLFLVLTSSFGFCQGNNSKLFKQLQKEAKEINATLPQMISKEIQMIRVIARSYNEIALVCKTLFYQVSDLDITTMESALKPQTQRSLCSDPDVLEMMKRGISYTYVYFDKNDKYIGEFTVTPGDCGF